MYTLYNRPRSGGVAVEAALCWADLPFKLVELESSAGTPLPDSFKDTNPWGQIPVLITPDGTVLTEVAAILVHLATQTGIRPLGPEPGSSAHARMMRWMMFASVNIYEAVLRRSYTFRFADEEAAYPAVRRAATTRMDDAWTVLEAHVGDGPFLLGESLSVGDLYLAMLTTWYRGELELPRLRALTQHTTAKSPIAGVWQRHYGDQPRS